MEKEAIQYERPPWGGPQGSSIGLLEYDAQTNENTEFIPEDDKFKWVDDLSVLEIINLIIVGLTSYNFKQHVASDIGLGQLYLPPENIKSQMYLDKIAEWTENNRMKLNEKKTKVMIFNCSNNYQFSTRLHLNDIQLETVSETHVLGTIISSDLSWHRNTQYLVKRGYARMIILRKPEIFAIL